jgi:uroporphyrinogen decarboxylase
MALARRFVRLWRPEKTIVLVRKKLIILKENERRLQNIANVMTPRERVLSALSHQNPDRVPLDLGSTNVTGINCSSYEKLKAYLNVGLGETKISDRAAQLAAVDEEVLVRLGIDTRGVTPGLPENSPYIEIPDENSYRDEWGLLWKATPESGSYSVVNSPLAGEVSLMDIFSYPWPDPADPGRVCRLRQRVLDLKARGDWAIILSLPSDIIAKSMLLRGAYDWFLDSAANQTLLCALLDQMSEIQLATCEVILNEVGDIIDVAFGFDDLAMQDRLFVSPKTYQRFLEPRLARYYEFVQAKTKAKIVHHTDGAAEPLFDSLMEMGVEAINPLQVSAKGMGDLQLLKKKYGHKLAFWGGIDTQHFLPHKTKEEIKEYVIRCIRELNVNGGYVLSAVHNIQEDVPPQNIVAMFNAAMAQTDMFYQ